MARKPLLRLAFQLTPSTAYQSGHPLLERMINVSVATAESPTLWTDDEVMPILEEVDRLKQVNYTLTQFRELYFDLLKEIEGMSREVHASRIKAKREEDTRRRLEKILGQTEARLFRFVDGKIPPHEVSKHALYTIKAMKLMHAV